MGVNPDRAATSSRTVKMVAGRFIFIDVLRVSDCLILADGILVSDRLMTADCFNSLSYRGPKLPIISSLQLIRQSLYKIFNITEHQNKQYAALNSHSCLPDPCR